MSAPDPVPIRRIRWHKVYYLLALFDVLTVLGGFYLTDRIGNVFRNSVVVNQSWVGRLERYSHLARLAGAVNAPGNDVFDDHDVEREQQRLTHSLAVFATEIAAIRHEAQQSLSLQHAAMVSADLDTVDRAMHSMVDEAHRIFQYFQQGNEDQAGHRMATMDRRYAELNAELAKLRTHGTLVQSELLARDEQRALSLALFEIPLGLAILVMVGGATYYGNRISAHVQNDARERERYIERLRQSEAEVRQNERRLAVSEERFHLASRATNDVLWDYDLGTGEIWRSDAFASSYGHHDTPRALAASVALVHPEDAERISNGIRDVLGSARDLWTAEYRFRRADGTYAWVLDRGIVMRGEDRNPRRLIGSMMDISERKEAERMKSDFVSFVSHQLRTPLSGMSWMLELAADTEDLPSQAQEYIADARESANRLVSLVNELLDIARLESGRTAAAPAAVSLDQLTRSVLQEFKGLVLDKQHDVVLDSSTAATVWADPQLVRQVVVNLVSNAIKYTPPGGHIAVGLHQDNGTVEWTVKDDGVGVPKRAQGRLFEKFYRADNVYTLDAEGTGLGLHLVRLIVQQAGGRVWCESEEGHGALFAFTLPVASSEEHTR